VVAAGWARLTPAVRGLRWHRGVKPVAVSLLIVLVAAVGAPRLARADRIAVFRSSAINLTDQEVLAFGELLRGALAIQTGDAVIGPSDPSLAGMLAPGPASPFHAGRHVLSSLTRLGNVIVVRAWLMEGNAQRHHAEIEARSLDDLKSAADRIARALITGTSAEEARTLDTVTLKEAAPRNRTFTERRGGLYTMPMLAVGQGQFMEPGIALGLQLRLDKTSHFYEVGGGFLIPTGSTDRPGIGGLYAELGAGRFLGGDTSGVYVVGGVSPRIWAAYGDAIMGFAPYVGIGAVLDRASSAGLYFDLRVAQNVVPFEPSGYDDDVLGSGGSVAEGDTVFPTELGARVGILF
jgi:hypothetical protein